MQRVGGVDDHGSERNTSETGVGEHVGFVAFRFDDDECVRGEFDSATTSMSTGVGEVAVSVPSAPGWAQAATIRPAATTHAVMRALCNGCAPCEKRPPLVLDTAT